LKKFRNILCVVAAEAACRPILERAVSLAENNQAELTVASTTPPDAADRGMPDEQSACADTLATLRAERRQLLESFLEPYQQRLSIQPEVLIGTGFLEIIRAVLRHRYDLVMKPAENPSLIERLFGNDDMHLLRRCPCPVWLTKPGEIANYRCILAAVDFDLEQPDAGESHLNQQILDLAIRHSPCLILPSCMSCMSGIRLVR
jgi:universal stress protein E